MNVATVNPPIWAWQSGCQSGPPCRANGNSGEHGCAQGDHYRTEADDSGVDYCLLERFALGMYFLDEVEQNDDVARDGTDRTGDSEKSHEPNECSSPTNRGPRP